MSSVKCPECSLTNWATAVTCKRCGNFLQPNEKVTRPSPSLEESIPGQYTAPVSSEQAVNADRLPDDADRSAFTASPPVSPNYQNPNQQFKIQRRGDNHYQNLQMPNQQYYSPVNLKNGMAMASMVVGILSFLASIFLVGILLAPVGLILGIIALTKANKAPHLYGGRGFAIAGIATSGVIILFVPIILAIAVPNFLASRRAATEGSALATLKTISAAEATYMASSYGKCGDLQTLIATRLLDVSLAGNEKNGYRFMVINLPAGGCEIFATPISATWGNRSFYYSTEEGLLRGAAKKGLPADKNDFPVKNDLSETSNRSEKLNQLPGAKPNEMVAISSLRTLQTAEVTYAATHGQGAGGDLQMLALQGLIKQNLADGEEGGYRFKVVKIPQGWEIFATPASNASGIRSFYIGQEGVLRGAVKNGSPADRNDPPIDF